MNRLRPAAVLLPLVAAALTLVTTAHAQSGETHPSDLMRLNQAASDTALARDAIPEIRAQLASAPDDTYKGVLRQMLLRALVTSQAPAKEIVAAADSAVQYLQDDPRQRITFFASVSQVTAEDANDKALGYARRAYKEAYSPGADVPPELRAFVVENLGFVHMKGNRPDSAIVYFKRALPISPDSLQVLHFLADQYQKKGNLDGEIDARIRALSVFPARDTTGIAALRRAYVARYHSASGLDARIEKARTNSLEEVALAPRRRDSPAPQWELQDLDGKTVQSTSLAGRVVVLDFWGSWCGPCRMELPMLQALYEKYRDRKDVRFMTVNWERDKTRHAELARDYVTKNNLTFPVVIDPEQSAVRSFNIEGFPTVFVIDAKGRIRYQNVGVAQNIEDILEAQIQSAKTN